MCRCTPEIKTPFCGRGSCVWPDEIKFDGGEINPVLKAGDDLKVKINDKFSLSAPLLQPYLKDVATATEIVGRQKEYAEKLFAPVVVKLEEVQDEIMFSLFAAYKRCPPRSMGREEWYALSHIVRDSRRKLRERTKPTGLDQHYLNLTLYGCSQLVIVP